MARLKLTIEPQQEDTLHHRAKDALWVASGAETLQDAVDVLTLRLNPHAWTLFLGGHHIAVHWGAGTHSVRVAMIAEVR